MISTLSTLAIGDFSHPEFRDARGVLSQHTRVRFVSGVEAALVAGQRDRESPDLFVLAQSRPGEISAGEFHRLRQAAPLARAITLLGTWCEGEGRSGAPLPGVVRLPWHQAAAWLLQKFERLRSGDCPAWGFPVTATEFDQAAALETTWLANAAGSVAIHSSNWEMAHWLRDICRRWGYSAALIRPGEAASNSIGAMVWDSAGLEEAELSALRAWSEVPTLVLLDFPRWEDHQRAASAGARAVLARPVRADELRWHLKRLLEPLAR